MPIEPTATAHEESSSRTLTTEEEIARSPLVALLMYPARMHLQVVPTPPGTTR